MRTVIYVYGYYPEEAKGRNGRIYVKKAYNLRGNWAREAIERFISKRFSHVLVRVQYSDPKNNFEYCEGTPGALYCRK